MGIGLFVVGLGYIRHTVRKPRVLRHSGFWKRMLLLGCVVLFVTYVTIAYEVDIEPPNAAESGSVALATVHNAKLLILTILPIDLLGIALTATLFAVLSLEDLPDLFQKLDRKFDLYDQIGLLFLLTGLWHVVMIGWWGVYSVYNGNLGTWFESWRSYQTHNLYDVLYHLVYGLGYLSHFYLWKKLSGGSWHRTRRTWVEWWGIAVYAVLVVTVYISRLSSYVDRYLAKHLDVEPSATLSVEAFLVPAGVCAAALLLLFASRRADRTQAAGAPSA